jgi:predicted ester cyclase
MVTSVQTDPAAVGRAYFEAVGRQDLEAMEGFYEPGGIGEIHGLVELQAPGNYRQWFGDLFRAVPDLKMEILDVVATGDVVAVRWRGTGVFDGDASFEGLKPNGSSVDIQGCDVLRIRNGRIQRNDAYTNAAQLARQLGALPAQGSFAERASTALVNLRTRLKRR